jgi:hypothetical protein
MKRKLFRALLAVAVAVCSVYAMRDFAGIARRSHTRSLAQELVAIPALVEKTPPGTARAEDFLRRLKAVDPGLAPEEVKQALHDYIVATEGALEAIKSGRDASRFDLPMAEAKKRLGESLQKYQ